MCLNLKGNSSKDYTSMLIPVLLEETLIKNPDASGLPKPSLQVIRSHWLEVSTLLNKRIAEQPAEEWFKRLSTVPEEDFIKEPHRNKLNLLLGRITHIAYHLGQLRLLKD